jgi:C4-dicarboxylate-specific signal transduction histidine kinase
MTTTKEIEALKETIKILIFAAEGNEMTASNSDEESYWVGKSKAFKEVLSLLDQLDDKTQM